MAQRKAEVWVTSVLEDDLVDSATVLAESLRKTKTTRTIAAITTRSLSEEKRVALHKAFDAIFYMDDAHFPDKGLKFENEELRAKIFVFSMHFLQKCVFISPNSLVLENMDKLFEDKVDLRVTMNAEDGSIDLSLFMLSPCPDMWERLWESFHQNGKLLSKNCFRQWLMNEKRAVSTIPDEVLAKFSVKSETLVNNQTRASIVQFIDVSKGIPFAAQIESLKKVNFGITEKLITEAWLQTYRDVLELIKNPITTRSLDFFANNVCYGENEPIAIVGMSCRYPGANNVEEFWNMLYRGEEGVREPPAFRWTKEHSLRVTQQERKTNAGFLSTTVDEFDAKFFGVSPKEAAYMDPQARLLHEVVWESLEDSGIDPLSLYGTRTGIFTGSWMNDYRDIVQGSTERDFFRTYMGNSIGAAAARLSFLLGLTGPSIATESGCSSAIVALDLAVKSLRNGESNLALAGGVNLLLHPFTSNIMDYVIAPNGRCKTFDSKADGFGRAEGCGVLVLKRMSDALRDRDNIWALIRGSAVSQEGLSRSLGTPTVHCEALAMQLALEDANIKPSQVSFVETHGTGTAVGDPMEVAAIAKAYYSPDRKEPLIIGSVKTNVGHTESCSGITGIMKTVLAMQHELIPKHRNLETLNPEIFLDSIPATIPLENFPWPKVKGQPRIAGVSSFGITGTDGHVIIEEAPDYQLPKFTLGLERPTHILKISGKSSEALEEMLKEYENLFSERAQKGDDAFANAAYSSNIGRAPFNHRTFIVGSNYLDAAKALQENQYLRGEVKDGETRQICFLFTGQGSQYQGMAKTLYETSPVFRVNFDCCERTLRELYNLSIREVLWESDSTSKELSRTIYSQISIFCIEYCLLKLWQSWGIHPDYVLGHSLGEFAAAVAAGVLDFEDALKLVAERSRLIDNLPRGSMLVIKASEAEVENLMNSGQFDLDFAAVNNPEQTVVAGDTKTIEAFLSFLKGKDMKATILEATHAFHSRYMDPMLEQYRKIAQTINYKMGNSVQYVSGMEGRVIWDSSEINADYWVRHTKEKVSFVDACAVLREANVQEYLELGPQPILSSFVMMNNDDAQMTCLPSLRRGTDDWHTILNSLGKLYLLGYKVDWQSFDNTYIRNKVSLPFHPFHRKTFWVEGNSTNAAMIHPLIGCSLNNASNLNIFQNDLSINSVPYLKDHCIGNRMLFPGAGYAEMCLSAGYCVANGLTDSIEPPRRALKLEEFRIDTPLELKEGKGCRFQVIVDLPDASSKLVESAEQTQGFRVKVFHQNTSSEDSDKWVLHASSTFIPVASSKDVMKKWNPERIKEIMSSVEPTPPEAFYRRADDTGLKFGETFRQIQRHWNVQKNGINSDEVVAEIPLPEDSSKYLLHPLIIDGAFQAGILTGINYDQFTRLKVPIRIGSLTLLNAMENKINDESSNNSKIYIHVWTEQEKHYGFIISEDFVPIAYLYDVELIDTNVRTIESVLEQQSSSIPDAWEEIWRSIPGPFTNATELTSMDQLFSQNYLQKEFSILSETSPDMVHVFVKTNRLVYLYTLNALYDLGWEPKLNESWSVQNFCEKFKILCQFRQMVHFYFTVFQGEDNVMEYNESTKMWTVIYLPPTKDNLKVEMENLSLQLKNTQATSTAVGIYEHIAKLLVNILKGEESALAILFPTEEEKQQYSADQYYHNHPGREGTFSVIRHTMASILKEQLSVNSSQPNRVYRVLEVGSGTGSLSQSALEELRKEWGDKFEYYYTDISQSFFIKAEKKFEDYSGNIKFAVFNLEESPLYQGIPLNYFDMVLATDVLHATRNLQECLVHIRQTMRPNATLFFTETIIAATDITFVFGLLEGYWRFEDFHLRPYHTCVDDETWCQVLKQSGFNPLNVTKCYAGAFGCISAEASDQTEVTSLIVKAVPAPEKNKKGWVVFCHGEDNATLHVANTLNSCGANVRVVLKSSEDTSTVNKAKNVLSKRISIATIQSDDSQEMETVLTKDCTNCILYAWGKDTTTKNQKDVALPFMVIAKWLLARNKPPSLFLITQGVHSINESVSSNPTCGTLFGMAKSLKNENTELFVRYIDLDNMQSDPQIVADQILYELVLRKGGSKESGRLQVAYRDNLRYEPKFVKASVTTKHDELQLPPSSDRYHLVLPKTRMIQDLEFDSLDVEEVKENEVEIKIKAFALNFKDILTILKPSEEFEQLNTVGLDFSGVVSKAGGEVESFKVGDRVFGANFKEAQLPSHLVLDAESILRIPDTMTFWEAATIPAVFATAYHCLINIAKMKKDDTVLIHTGSGGVGLAAIQLAKHVGATIITTAGSSRKRAYLKNIGVEHVFHSRNTSYEKEIMKVTQGKGVDVVLNSITGPGLKEATLASCAQKARFVEMSKLSIWTPEEVRTLRPDVDYSIVDLTVLEKEAWSELLKNMTDYLEHGYLRAIPYVKYDALMIRQALQFFQKARHIGKVVCTMPEVVTQDGVFKSQVRLFNDESTYLITGGLGGIGFEVCLWMLEKGATDIVLTARSPPKTDIAAIIDNLNKKGFNIVVKQGDVSNFHQIKQIIDYIGENGKPLRGVMHCAGVLRDDLYANQTWETFDATFKPKVEGTWHLHNLTKDMQLEHFVLYSSITALMGTPSQPNHAAANCFEDVLAHYRHSMGLPAMTINWGQWAQVGCAKEVALTGVRPVSVKRMLNGLEMAMKTQRLQICFSEFESFKNLSMLIPTTKCYLDEKLWKQVENGSQTTNVLNSEKFWGEMEGIDDKSEKVELVGNYLKLILRASLRLDAGDPISDDVNIQDLGVDSLMLIELKNSIQSLLGSRILVTSGLLKNCNTVRQLATAIVEKIMEDVEGEAPEEPLSIEEFDQLLQMDCQLEDSIRNTDNASRVVKPSNIRTILITGATGQLGTSLLTELSNKYLDVSKLVCLVREKTGTTLRERIVECLNAMDLTNLVNMAKIECVAGDVTQPYLGMDQETYDRLTESIDAVIHCAGKSNSTESYRKFDNGKGTDIRSVHVDGTTNVLKFACNQKIKQVYFASTFTCGIFGENSHGTLSDEWLDKNVLKASIDAKLPGLQMAKLVCELLIKEANLRGIPCKVFRFPWIAGHSQTGRLDYLNNLYLLRYLSFLKVCAMPSLPLPANLLPVDLCAEISLKLFFNDEAPFEIFNVGHPQPQMEQEFLRVAKEEMGKDLEIVEWKEFAERLQENDTQVDNLKDQKSISMYMADAAGFVSGYLVSPDNFFRNEKVSKFIPDFEGNVEPSMEIVRRDLKYLKSTGFLEKFGI